MLLMICTAVMFAALMVLVVVPPLFIFNLEDDQPTERDELRRIDTIVDGILSSFDRQRIYVLLMVPVCSVSSVILLYWFFYRRVRFIQYRLEQNVLSLRYGRLIGFQQLKNAGLSGLLATESFNMSMALPSISARLSGGGGDGIPDKPAFFPSNVDLSSAVNIAQGTGLRMSGTVELRPHARPSNVPKDTYINFISFPEIRKLARIIEERFITPADIAEVNFWTAIRKVMGGDEVDVAETLRSGRITANGCYNSKANFPVYKKAMPSRELKRMAHRRTSSVILTLAPREDDRG